MNFNIEAVAEVNRQILERLAGRENDVKARENRARHTLDLCQAERREIEEERAAVQKTEEMYRRLFGSPPGLQASDDGGEGQRRARVGAQRYRMLVALRESGPLSTQSIADRTHLLLRRVRDQMRSDEQDGVVTVAEGIFSLTESGADLLSRYEAYKKNRGEPLPSLDELIADDEREEVESEPQSMKGVEQEW